MRKVCIIVPAGEAILSSIVGPWKILNAANDFVRQANPHAPLPFEPLLLGLQRENNLYGGTFNIRAHLTLEDQPEPDLVIIPAIRGDIEAELRNNAPFVQWVQAQYARGAEIASLCIGAFLLAQTGLLNGKSCTTHWSEANRFRQYFPEVELLSEKIITEDNGIFTSGGAYSFLNLVLYLVEKYVGREIAVLCSKFFEVDIDRYHQSQFAIFQGQKEHEDQAILKAQQYIESHVHQKLSIDDIADMVAISRRNFIRRFKKATHNTPLEYIQRVRIEAAKRFLESSSMSIYEVMFEVGYQDTKAFRNLFRKLTGLTPKEYRQKYNRVLAVV